MSVEVLTEGQQQHFQIRRQGIRRTFAPDSSFLQVISRFISQCLSPALRFRKCMDLCDPNDGAEKMRKNSSFNFA